MQSTESTESNIYLAIVFGCNKILPIVAFTSTSLNQLHTTIETKIQKPLAPLQVLKNNEDEMIDGELLGHTGNQWVYRLDDKSMVALYGSNQFPCDTCDRNTLNIIMFENTQVVDVDKVMAMVFETAV